MKNFLLKSFVLILFCLVANGCKDDGIYPNKGEDEKELVKLKAEIDQMSAQVSCDDTTEWKFIGIGAQSCGGSTGFVAYSNKIDEALFLNKVAFYTQKQKEFNVKWKIVSLCALLAMPKGIECVNGKPKFIF